MPADGTTNTMASDEWYVYIVECADGTLYTGITTDIERRVDEHNAGKGARYTRSRRPVVLCYQESQPDRSLASIREYRIKALSRAGKLKLIEEGLQCRCKKLSRKKLWRLEMKLMGNKPIISLALKVLCLVLVMSFGLQADDADLSSSVTLPASIPLGQPFTVTVGYANAGPDTANNAYPNGEFIPPMGLDVFLDNYWNGDGSFYDNLQASAIDSLGNVPLLFWDDFYCETVSFQVQGVMQPGPVPIAPLAAGESGSFTFETAFPMDSPRGGNIEITSPDSLAKIWTLTDPSNFFIGEGYATTYSGFSTSSCEQIVGLPEEDVCAYIDGNCWGTKVSHLAVPFEAEFVLVDDGSADPTFGCSAIINDVVGKIAVVERGTCEFGIKGLNAEQAGAVAVFMVNSNLCSPPDFPDSDQCVINMGPGVSGAPVTIPIVMVSQADGTPVVDALVAAETVTGVFGSSSVFAAQGWAYHDGASGDTDPDSSNDVSIVKSQLALFADGFESGDTAAWTDEVP